MNTSCRAILRDLTNDLDYEKVNHYTVKEFCQTANIARSTFYRNYRTIDELYKFVLDYKFSEILNHPQKIAQQYSNLLSYLKAKQVFILNIYHLTDRTFFLKVMEPHFLANLKQHYQKETLFSDYALNLLVNSISRVIIDWIENGMKEDVTDVVVDVRRVLAVAENVVELIGRR